MKNDIDIEEFLSYLKENSSADWLDILVNKAIELLLEEERGAEIERHEKAKEPGD